MRLKRFQKGSVRPRKHGRHKVWVAQWWEDGRRKSKVLGKCSEISKSQADIMMAAILEPLNERAGKRQPPVYTFKRYVEDVFLPVCRRKWKESTRMTSEPTIQTHLTPAFGSRLMSEISRDDMQAFLDQKAKTHSQSIVAHLRWHLSAIFKMALSDGVVDVNPTIALFTPACKPGEDKRVMSRDQILQALQVLDLRERLMFRMAVFEGMRPGEIFAIRIGRVHENSVRVNLRVYRGNLDTPKGRKGKRTARTGALSPGTVADLKLWRSRFPEAHADAFLFPSELPGKPLSRDNVWRRYIRPKLESIGLGWVTFQGIRRTNASLSRKAKVDDKVAADQRGHGLGVSLEVYAVSDLQQKIDAVTRLESEVIQQ
jgi:integrase